MKKFMLKNIKRIEAIAGCSLMLTAISLVGSAEIGRADCWESTVIALACAIGALIIQELYHK